LEQGAENREHDRWASGSAYEDYVGRWSKQVAREFVGWLGVTSGKRWLDVGCGTGALTRTVLDQASPGTVIGVEPSTDFVAYARHEVVDPRAEFVGGDGIAIPLADGACDYAVSGLVLNFVPDPSQMVTEMARVVRPGGMAAVYVWDYAGEMQMMRHFWDAVVELDPVARRFDEGMRFSICNPESLTGLFEAAGLTSVKTTAIDIPTHFASFDDYWSPFLGGTGAAPGYVASLDEEDRAALRERLRERLPTRADGSIDLMARAWAVAGLRA
jgi:SAM-dependent methyltransferase